MLSGFERKEERYQPNQMEGSINLWHHKHEERVYQFERDLDKECRVVIKLLL